MSRSDAGLPAWPEIALAQPHLARRLRADPRDHDALVEFACLALGAQILAEHHRADPRLP